ncbi:MAG: UMP kinase [Bacteroidales bacterium]|nr:UMP kinase [Bacteroidales bacterium]
MKYKRVLLKLSGEALMGEQQYGIDPQRLDDYTEEIASAVRAGAQIGIVIGGGNIFRGLQGASKGFDRVYGDEMGMLATVINSLALQSSLSQKGIKTVLLSGIGIDKIAELMSGPKAIGYLEQGYVVIIGGGTGNPYFTTDTGSTLRAIEIKADIILKGTRVDGIYTADPEKDPKAKKFERITYTEAYEKNLKIMDLTAFTMCKENNMPMLVFNMNEKGNLTKVLKGENIGTLVTNDIK